MSALTKMISSPKTLASIKALHKLVKTHVAYGRVWSDKRLTESKTTVFDHRIKYTFCSPQASQMDSLNKALKELGLRAKQYNSFCSYYNKSISNNIVIEHLSLEQKLINTFTL